MTRAPLWRREYERQFKVQVDTILSATGVLYGEDARRVRTAAETKLIADASKAMAIFPRGAFAGNVVPEGVPIDTSYDAIVAVSLRLPGNGAWYGGPSQTIVVANAQNVALAPPAGYDADASGNAVWVACRGAPDGELATAVLGGSDAFSLADGVRRLTSVDAAIAALDPSAAPGAAVMVTVLYGTRIGDA